MRQPLSLKIRRSRTAATLLIVLHGLGVAALAASQIPLIPKFVLLLMLAWSLAQGLQNYVLRTGRRAIVAMTLRESDEWELTFLDGDRVTAKIDPSSTVLYWLMALRFRAGKKQYFVWLLPDMLDAESWRLLSVSLRATTADVK